MAPGIPGFAKEDSMNSWLTWGYWYMFLLLKELLQPDGLPAPTHPLGRGVFNETPSPNNFWNWQFLGLILCGYKIFSNTTRVSDWSQSGSSVWLFLKLQSWYHTRFEIKQRVHAVGIALVTILPGGGYHQSQTLDLVWTWIHPTIFRVIHQGHTVVWGHQITSSHSAPRTADRIIYSTRAG